MAMMYVDASFAREYPLHENKRAVVACACLLLASKTTDAIPYPHLERASQIALFLNPGSMFSIPNLISGPCYLIEPGASTRAPYPGLFACHFLTA